MRTHVAVWLDPGPGKLDQRRKQTTRAEGMPRRRGEWRMGWDGMGWDVDVIGCDVSLANKNNDGTAREVQHMHVHTVLYSSDCA